MNAVDEVNAGKPGRQTTPPTWVLQVVASSAGTMLGQVLGESTLAKLIAGGLGAAIGAFLTAPGGRYGRRIVAVGLIVLLLDWLREAGTAVAADWAPSRAGVIVATGVAGFAIGTGVTAAAGGFSTATRSMTPVHHGAARSGGTGAPSTTTATHSGSTATASGPGGGVDHKSEVPALVGLAAVDATAALKQAGLVATQTSEPSTAATSGRVLRSDPGSGTRVPRGSGVAMVIGSGPVNAMVPPVSGLLLSAATAALSNAGFNPFVATGGASDNWTVTGQSPAGGSSQPPRSTVSLTASCVPPACIP